MSGNLVTLWKFRDLPEALLAKGKLEAAGITVFLLNDEMIRMDWFYSNLIGGIVLQVPPDEAQTALELLQEPIPESINPGTPGLSYLQPRCPKCNSLDVEHEGLSKLVTFGTWLALGFPIRTTVDQWRCAECGNEWQYQAEDETGPSEVSPEVMTRIYVATTNPGKIKDFSGAARALDLDLVSFPTDKVVEVVEDGTTFEENAIKKAEAYSLHLPNELVIADDSGLEVAALNGAPGVYSARFAQTHAASKPSDSDNNYKLLHELSLRPGCDRSARFVCVIAAARNGHLLKTFRGEASGEILPTPIGKRGFGYDPLFYVPAASKTFAEMSPEEKAQYSHRGAAFRAFLQWLEPEIARKD
jgi:XTP/dITP diphosphohydrolase